MVENAINSCEWPTVLSRFFFHIGVTASHLIICGHRCLWYKHPYHFSLIWNLTVSSASSFLNSLLLSPTGLYTYLCSKSRIYFLLRCSVSYYYNDICASNCLHENLNKLHSATAYKQASIHIPQYNNMIQSQFLYPVDNGNNNNIN